MLSKRTLLFAINLVGIIVNKLILCHEPDFQMIQLLIAFSVNWSSSNFYLEPRWWIDQGEKTSKFFIFHQHLTELLTMHWSLVSHSYVEFKKISNRRILFLYRTREVEYQDATPNKLIMEAFEKSNTNIFLSL